MASRDGAKKDRMIGLKVPNWKREALKEVAHRQRTSLSGLLRQHVDDELDGQDIDDLLDARGYDSQRQEPEAEAD